MSIYRAEVSCRDAIRQARLTRNPTKGLSKLASVKLKKSEQGVHKVFKDFGASLPIQIARVDLPSKKSFPYVPFRHWLEYLVKNDELERICGVSDVADMQKVLTLFWDRYKQTHGNHEIYSRAASGLIDMSMCLPVLYHGDEGRGLKKKQVMIASTHGVIGAGCSHQNNDLGHPSDPSKDPLRLNMIGNTLLNHFIQFAAPIGLYNKSPESFDRLLDLQAKEFRKLFYEGAEINGRRFFIACIGVKGDAPFLVKAGKFERSFAHKPTRPSSKKPAGGVCHLCCAGKEDLHPPAPYEDYGSVRPAWRNTVGLLRPYSQPSPLLQIPLNGDGFMPEKLFQYDLFHNWHMGVGKTFISSAVCICLELVDETIECAFETITEDFKAYCARNRESPYHKSLTASLFGIQGSFQSWPEAGWSKGDFTRLLNSWFEDYCSRKVVGHTRDPLCLKCVTSILKYNF